MRKVISSLESTAESLTKLTSAALKFCIALGSACVAIYALRIGHFPQGLTLGDGLLFMLAASCFGVVYAMFVGCFLSLGMCMAIVIRPILNFSYKLIQKRTNSRKEMAYEMAKFHWAFIPLAVIALIFILAFGTHDTAVYWNLPMLSVGLYFLYSAATSAGRKYRHHERLLNSIIVTPEKDELLNSDKAGKQKSTYLVCITLIMLLPLVTGGVSGLLMDGAMRIAQVRIEHCAIYVKAPFSALIPDDLIAKDLKAPAGYKAYANVVVQFKGFGNSTVIAFKEGQIQRQLDIPNELIIVEKHPK